MKINHALIAGAGAIGLSVAATLIKADPRCVSILAKGARLERYRKNGLRVNGETLAFRFSSGEVVDLIIIAGKFHHLNQIIEDIRPSVGKETIILSLLNGITSEDIVGREFGRERLPLAMVLGTDAFHQGEETTYKNQGFIHFGDMEGKNGEREASITEFFTRTGVPFVLEPNMLRKFWFKYMMNVGINQTTAVLKLPYGALQNIGGKGESAEARRLVEKAMREVIAVANVLGINLNDDDIGDVFNTIDRLDPCGYTSMCQDVLAGRKTEVEMFSLALMELAKRHNIPTPVNETLYLQLRTIESRNL